MATSEHDDAKELTRKLYWAVSSTFPLDKPQKGATFTWAAQMADRIIARRHSSRPPSVDKQSSNGYHGQADGRGGGRNRPSIQRDASAPPSPDMAAWSLDQQAKRDKAWAYVLAQNAKERQLPIPASVYREVGNGLTDSIGR